jgi:hypothetical protein
MDAEKRLRLAAQSLNRDVLGFDADAFTQHLLKGLGIEPFSEDCARDAVPRADRTPTAGPGAGGRRRQNSTTHTTEFFDLELEELMHNTTLHSNPQVLRRIAELTEFKGGTEAGEASRVWWLRAARAGDHLAALRVSEWESEVSEGTTRRQTPEDL